MPAAISAAARVLINGLPVEAGNDGEFWTGHRDLNAGGRGLKCGRRLKCAGVRGASVPRFYFDNQ
jgi:hypothetical protein